MKPLTYRFVARGGRAVLPAVLVAALAPLAGCEVDSFFDPSRTGRFEFMPTTIPILDRIDVIEHEQDLWGQTTSVTEEDLIPSELSYKMAPGDLLTVQIFELYTPGVWHSSSGQIDAGGFFRLPEIGDVQAAGMTAQEFEDRVTRLLHEEVMENPLVDVVIEQGGGFRYTLYGAVASPGWYNLQSPDLRMIDALAIAGGVPLTTKSIYVIRQVELSERVKPRYDQDRGPAPPPGRAPEPPTVPIEELIEQLEPGNDPAVQPGILRQEGEPIIDIDELEPIRQVEPPAIDLDDVNQPTPEAPIGPEETFIFDEQRGEWIRVRREAAAAAGAGPAAAAEPQLLVERVIQIPFQRLKRGDNTYNIVIRPNDRIYVEEGVQGVVYVDGEVVRRGVYSLPTTGGKLTLSRLIAAAGGFSPLAIPERVDLTRMVGENREATIRLNLKAIRNRTEPDVLLKPDDEIIVGTNFWAQPLAVIRNGFRATYGFGFLLDRNFGTDVFGPVDVNRN